jgi:hypothetical protein
MKPRIKGAYRDEGLLGKRIMWGAVNRPTGMMYFYTVEGAIASWKLWAK